jgi:hypothetical protein
MKRFVEGLDRGQSTLFPASLDDYVTEGLYQAALLILRHAMRIAPNGGERAGHSCKAADKATAESDQRVAALGRLLQIIQAWPEQTYIRRTPQPPGQSLRETFAHRLHEAARMRAGLHQVCRR